LRQPNKHAYHIASQLDATTADFILASNLQQRRFGNRHNWSRLG